MATATVKQDTPCDRCRVVGTVRWVSKIGAWLCSPCRSIERKW